MEKIGPTGAVVIPPLGTVVVADSAPAGLLRNIAPPAADPKRDARDEGDPSDPEEEQSAEDDEDVVRGKHIPAPERTKHVASPQHTKRKRAA